MAQEVALVKAVHPVNSFKNLRKELVAARKVLVALPSKVDALDLLEWNRAHKKGSLYIRSCVQYLGALDSEADHLVNDYSTHDFGHCRTCTEHKIGRRDLVVPNLRRAPNIRPFDQH